MSNSKPSPGEPWFRSAFERIEALSPLTRGGVAWLGLFLLLTVIHWRHRELPYYWDALGYVFPHTEEIYQSNLFPILRHWDVGHPTAYFFTLAVVMKMVGVSPLAGHLVVWGFTALLVVAIHGLGRVLELPRIVSAAAALLFLVYPLVWAMSLQLLADLPLLAVTLASYWLWVRNRRIGYVLLASYGLLMKLHGFALLAGPVLATIVTSGAFWHKGQRRAFLRNLAWTSSPLLALAAFVVVRYLVRGPGLTIGWVSGNKPVPFWHFHEFLPYVPKAYDRLYQVALSDYVLYATLAILLAVGAAGAIRLARGLPRRDLLPSREATRLFWALVFLALANNVMFFQSESLCARYVFPTVAVMFLLSTWGLWVLTRRPRVIVISFAFLAALFVVLWHPKYGARLPPPLSTWLQRPPVTGSWQFENDLRFLDVIHQIRWAGREVIRDSRATGTPLSIATQWPMTVAYGVPRMGYVPIGIPTSPVETWNDLHPENYPYVVLIRPISALEGPPPDDRFTAQNVAAHRRHEITVEIWRVTARK